MPNKLNTSITTVLLHAKEKDQWVSVEHLAPHGLHTTLVHILENMGYIITSHTGTARTIKLTLQGYKHYKGHTQ